MNAHLIYHIYKGLGIVSTEMSDYLGLITVRNNGFDQRDALACGKGRTDQLFPGWEVRTVRENCQAHKQMSTRTDGRQTGWEELSRLLKPPGVSEDPGPSSVVSMSITHS